MEKVPMTQEGYARLETRLKELKSVERPAIIKQIAEAREHGDISENAEYHAARERQSMIEGQILELEDKIARAEVIDVSQISGKTIKFGARVTLADDDTDEEAWLSAQMDPCNPLSRVACDGHCAVSLS